MKEAPRSTGWNRPVAVLVVLSLLVGACGAEPTPAPLPTDTPQPTATAPPTATPLPTPTPSPTPVPLADYVAEGDELLKKSDFAGAEAAYQRALEADAEYAPAYIGLSELYSWQTGREDDALVQAEKAVELAPDSADAYVVLAQAHAVRLAPGESLTAGERAVELDEESARAQSALARAYVGERHYEDALRTAEVAIALDPELAEAYYSLGVCYEGMADFARGRAAYEQAIALEPEFASWHAALASLWGRAEDHEQAESLFQRALELNPEFVQAILGMAYVDIDRREYQEAEAQIEQAIELAPNAPHGYVALGYLYSEQDESDEALAQFRKALERWPGFWTAEYAIGQVHLDELECDSAALQAQELMTLQPRYAAGPYVMGLAKLCEWDTNKALEYLRKAQDLEPYDAYTHLGLGYAYAAQDRWEEAIEAFVQALRFSAAGALAHTALGDILDWQGETDLAEAEQLVALRLDPDSVQALVSLSSLLAMQDKHGDAQARAEQALSLKETEPDAQRLLGASLLAQGFAQEAAECLEQLVEQEPEDVFGHFYLGLAYRDLGQYADAKKELETYLALNPTDPDRERIDVLIEALGQGYVMTEEKATADLTDLLADFLDTEPDVRVEEMEGKGRTLIISLSADPDQEQRQEVIRMIVPLALAALYAMRLEPPVENGVLVRIEENDQAIYSLGIGLTELKEWWVGIISNEQLDSVLEYSRLVPTEELAPLEEIQAGLAETRELEAEEDVSYESLTREELGQYVTGSMDAQAREAMRASDSLLTLLGVLEPDVDLEELRTDLYTEQVTGFYSPKEQAFYVVERENQSALDQMVIAHEYVHALQDQHFGLEELRDEALDADQLRAVDALVEGDATLTMLLYASQHIGLFDLLQAQSTAGGFESEVLDASPTFIQEVEMFPYQEGLQFVVALHDSGGWSAVDESFEDPPQSTEQILHPERYRQGDAPHKVSLPDLAEQLGAGWQEVESDVLGELFLQNALAAHMGPGAATQAAEGWAGDRYALLQQGEGGPHLLVIRTYWDDQDESDEFWALAAVCMDHREGYMEEVTQLVGELQSRRWLGDEGAISLAQQDRYVDIILGPDAETVEQVAALLPGPE